jgi:hypothetical protein
MRRRSVAQVCGMVLAALLGGALGACAKSANQQVAQPSSTTGSPTATASAAPSPTATATTLPTKPAEIFLGPFGYGRLKLRQPEAQAKATGLATDWTGSGPGCSVHAYLVGSPTMDELSIQGRIFVSSTYGVVAIYAYPGIKTPKGIGLGSTYAQLHQAYPAVNIFVGDNNNGRGSAPVPGNAHASYRIIMNSGKVSELSLDSDKQDCYE